MFRTIAAAIVLTALAAVPAGAMQLVYSNTFENLDGLTGFGSPKPRLNTRTPDGSAYSFDNNGDPNYSSGAIINNYGFDYANGAKIEYDAYVTKSDSGCWLSSFVYVSSRDSYGSTSDPGSVMGFGIQFVGNACWASPSGDRKKGHLQAWYRGQDGQSYSFKNMHSTQWSNRWIHLEFIIDADLMVHYIVDGVEMWSPTVPVDPQYAGRFIWLGSRSSSYGDGLHDNLMIYEGAENPVPEPMTAVAAVSALAGLGGYLRRRR